MTDVAKTDVTKTDVVKTDVAPSSATKELPKNRKEAYKQLTEAMKGRKEGDIGLADEYWELRNAIHKAESNNYFTEPDKETATVGPRDEPVEKKEEVKK